MTDSLYDFGEWLETTPWAHAMGYADWIFPVVAAVHFFSVFLFIGMIVVFNLRVLGVAGRRQSVTQVSEELSPWTWTGFGLAALSGFLMFSPGAGELFKTRFFLPKLFMVLLGLAGTLLVQRNVRKWDQPGPPPPVAKLAAFLSLAIWIVALLIAVEVGQYVNE